MRIIEDRPSRQALSKLGAKAMALRAEGAFAVWATRFGWACAYGGDKKQALEPALGSCLCETDGTMERTELPVPGKDFQVNDTDLLALRLTQQGPPPPHGARCVTKARMCRMYLRHVALVAG
jgi:hypothetical protein